MKKILIVDDNATNRELILAVLMNSGWQCLEADNGVKALELTLKEKPDLIITDIEMPIMRGTDFIKELRQTKDICDITVIFYTAANYVPDASLLSKCYGVPLVLVKPTDINVIQDTLKNVMEYIENDILNKEKKSIAKENDQVKVYISDLDNLKIAIDALSTKSDVLAKENLQILLKILYDPKKVSKKLPEEIT